MIFVKLISGQDTIVKINGERINCQVTLNTILKVEYNKGTSFNYSIPKSEVSMIKFANGVIKKYDQASIEIIDDSPITKKGHRYYQDGKMVPFKEIKSKLLYNPTSTSEFRKYQKNNAIGKVLLYGGTLTIFTGAVINFLSVVQKAEDINNEEIQGNSNLGLYIMLAGVGLDLIGLPLVISAKHHFKKSIILYNSNFKTQSYNSIRIDLQLNPYGVGLSMKF